MLVQGFARRLPDSAPIPKTSCELRLHDGDVLVATTQTDAAGMYRFLLNGNPGPYYIRLSYEGETQITSSKVTGLSGPTDVANLPLYFRLWSDGYVAGVLGQLAVSATGAGMQVSVAAGAAIVRGVLYDQFEALALPIAAASTQPRIDRIVVEVVPPGADPNTEGRTRLVVKTGTPAASPTAPSLTQTSTLWQIPLAQVRVDPSVSAIAANKVTDERAVATIALQPKSVTTATIADKAVGNGQLSDNAVDARVLAANAVETAKVKDGAITTAKLAANAVDPGRMSSGSARSTAATALVLKAATGSATPAYGSLTTKELADWTETAPTTGQYPRWNGSAWAPATLPASGAGIEAQHNDENFNPAGPVGGAYIPLGTVSVVLDPGRWLLECRVDMTVRGTGNGEHAIRLIGSGTPQGAAQSERVFEHVGGVPRSSPLSGRRTVDISTKTTFSATAQIRTVSGASADARSGVVYLVATPR